MKRLLFALILALWPAAVGAEDSPKTSAMYREMQWCLPMTAAPVLNRPNSGDDVLPVNIEKRGFLLLWMEPDGPALNFLTVQHPKQPWLRIGFSNTIAGPQDEAQIFIQLSAGCFVLTPPPAI